MSLSQGLVLCSKGLSHSIIMRQLVTHKGWGGVYSGSTHQRGFGGVFIGRRFQGGGLFGFWSKGLVKWRPQPVKR